MKFLSKKNRVQDFIINLSLVTGMILSSRGTIKEQLCSLLFSEDNEQKRA